MTDSEPERRYRKLLASEGHSPTAYQAQFNGWANIALGELLALVAPNRLDNARSNEGAHQIFCGLWPAKEISARTLTFRDGATLILVNDGLIFAVEELTKYAAAAMPLNRMDGSDVPPDLHRATARANIFFNLTGKGRAEAKSRTHRWNIDAPELSPERNFMFRRMITQSVHFIIAHELAHSVLNHTQHDHREGYSGRFSKWWFVRGLRDATARLSAIANELSADCLAAAICAHKHEIDEGTIASLPNRPDQSHVKQLDQSHFGAIVYFEIMRLRESVVWLVNSAGQEAYAGKARSLSSHPHPEWRRAVAIAFAHRDGWDAQLPVCDRMVSLFDYLHLGYEFERDVAIFEKLIPLAESANYRIFSKMRACIDDRVIFANTVVDDSYIKRRLKRRRLRSVIPYVAAAALTYAMASRTVSPREMITLGIVYEVFRDRYLSAAASEEAKLFDRDIRRLVPELDWIIRIIPEIFFDAYSVETMLASYDLERFDRESND